MATTANEDSGETTTKPLEKNSNESQKVAAAVSLSPHKGASSPSSVFSLSKCSAQSLALHLLHNKFENDEKRTRSFFNDCLASLPGGDAVSSENNNNSDLYSDPTTILGKPLHSSPITLFCISPRSRFFVTCHESGLFFTTVSDKNKDNFCIPSSHVQRMISFPKPEDCYRVSSSSKKKDGVWDDVGMMMLIILKTTTAASAAAAAAAEETTTTKMIMPTFRKKPFHSICLQLPPHDDEVDKWKEMMMGVIGNNVVTVRHPKDSKNETSAAVFSYESETGMRKGLPFVRCYKGVQEGALFPLQEGLLFFKPAIFYPRSNLRSIGVGRGGTNSNSRNGGTRYVDMKITVQNDDDNRTEEVEFTNIERDEVKSLNAYVHKVLLPIMKREAATKTTNTKKTTTRETIELEETKSSGSNQDDDDDDDDDDGDYQFDEETESSSSDDSDNDDVEIVNETISLSSNDDKDKEEDDDDDETNNDISEDDVQIVTSKRKRPRLV